MSDERVSILMLTYNAPHYVRIAIDSIRSKTDGVSYELVVVDNASEKETRQLVVDFKNSGKIDRLELSDENLLFAGGNNLAATVADPRATHYLLLNSDIEVIDAGWLRHLLDIHRSPGITAYGYCHNPSRVDGYCLLIDAQNYHDLGMLDEKNQWWWSVTKLQAKAICQSQVVQGYYSHDDMIVHFGGKSGDGFREAKGMNVSRFEAASWFNGDEPILLDPENVKIPTTGALKNSLKKIKRALS